MVVFYFPDDISSILSGDLRASTADGNLPDTPHVIVVPPSLFRQWGDEFRRYVQHGHLDLIPYQGQWDEDIRTAVWDAVNTLQDGPKRCQNVILDAGPVRCHCHQTAAQFYD